MMRSNWLTTVLRSAWKSTLLSSSFSSARTVIFARRYGSDCVNSCIRVRETPMMMTKRFPSGVFMTR